MSAPAVALVHAGESFGKPIGDVVRFREQLRVVEIEIVHEGGVPVGARFMASGAAQLGSKFEDQAIAECAALTIEDIRADRHLPQLVTLGVGFVFAEVKSLEALERCEAVLERFKIHLPTETVGGFYLYVRSGEGTNISIRSRTFPPIGGIDEDPATGRRGHARCLAGRLESDADDLTVDIDQGVEMGRPSGIDVGVRQMGSRR